MSAAWIGFAAGVLGAVISAVVAVRQANANRALEVLKADLQERQALFERGLNAEEVLAKYREPLAAAAFDLQSRLYNILRLDFLEQFSKTDDWKKSAVQTTMFRLAQYFGWTEILRRDIQFLNFPEAEETKRVANLVFQVSSCWLSSSYGQAMMIWRDEQRALGELMIMEAYGQVLSMGYATFSAQYALFKPWCERLERELYTDDARVRMREAQHVLCDLVEALDKNHIRYTEAVLKRA